jgi:hypothetical protein
MLLSAGTEARREKMRGRAGHLLAEVDWKELTDTLRWRKLLTVLGPRIRDLAEDSAPGEFGLAVDEALEAGRRQGVFLQLISLRVTAMLAEAGIRSSPLKGSLLSEAIYGDPGRRLSSDIDLLVAPEQLWSAVEVVRELGYRRPHDHTGPDGLPQLHFALAHENGELPPVELHWRIHWYEREFARRRLLPPAVEEANSWSPAPTDELAALLLFYARDGFIDLRLATDLGAWWDRFGANLPAACLEELVSAFPAFSRVLPVAARVADAVVGLPMQTLTGKRAVWDLRERAAARLANPHPRASQSQLYADRGLIDGLLSPAGDFNGFVRRQLLPPREVLEQQAGHASRAHVRSSLGRFAGTLTRYGRTTMRLARPQERLRPADDG